VSDHVAVSDTSAPGDVSMYEYSGDDDDHGDGDESGDDSDVSGGVPLDQPSTSVANHTLSGGVGGGRGYRSGSVGSGRSDRVGKSRVLSRERSVPRSAIVGSRSEPRSGVIGSSRHRSQVISRGLIR
jgi:hypothetical protein